MREASDILILGIGNLLLSDDGFGIHAIRALQLAPPPGALLVDGGTAVLHMLPFVEKARRVLVLDAVRAGGRPGDVYRMDIEETLPRDWRISMHALGIREALQTLSPGIKPPPMTVIGVEPQSLDYGMELSAAVKTALPKAVIAAQSWAATQARMLAQELLMVA